MWNEFVRQFITLRGYENVLKGLWATMQIAVIGLLIGIAPLSYGDIILPARFIFK